MSKESGNGGSGLLSKVVKFVKSPTTHWADLDRLEAEDSNSESRLALKEMIERKRRNDFVRNREFDMLRKVRRRESVSSADLGGGPSLYPSSQPANTGERARTLKKIDEIEAQMSTSWFKRNGSPDAQSPAQVPAAPGAAAEPEAYQRTDPAPMASGSGVFGEPAVSAQAFAPTLTMDQALPPAPAALAPAPAPLDEGIRFDMSPVSGPAPAIVHSGPAPSAPVPAPVAPAARPRLLGDVPEFNVEVLAASRQDPEIEEAAILYANGDAASAESVLLGLIAPGGSRHEDVGTWLTLFDLYRCIGDPVKFDDVAWDFAALFGRSAPQWALMSEVVSAPAPIGAAALANPGGFDWVCPSVIGTQSVAALRASLKRHPAPWRINWQHVKTIELAALGAFTELLKQWADAAVELRFMQVERLLEVLSAQSPTDDRDVDPRWWTARLALLRVLNEADEFELVALNYCVTYEISPPAWETPKNRYRALDEEGQTLPPTEAPAPPVAALNLARPSDLEPGAFKARLEGEYVGSADAALDLVKDHISATAIEFNCRQLLRVDFGAAGDLLNWALEAQGRGCQVTFKQVNRLVAAFFGVIGITDASRVLLRTD